MISLGINAKQAASALLSVLLDSAASAQSLEAACRGPALVRRGEEIEKTRRRSLSGNLGGAPRGPR